MRMLCCSDHDKVSPSIARLAMDWAAITGDSVILAHARPRGIAKPMEHIAQARHERILSAPAWPSGAADDTESDTVLVRTMEMASKPTAAALATIASRASTRMIVVGAPHSDGCPEADRLSAQFAEAVAESAPVPTLVVRDAEALRQWLGGGRTLRVFCAYEFSATSDGALGVVKDLQSLAPCTVTVGHVARLGEERLRLGIHSKIDLGGDDPDVDRILERDLRERVDGVMGYDAGVETEVSGTWGRPDFEIIARAKQCMADLLVIGTHQWHGLQRMLHPPISRTVLRHAPMNLLVVPRADSQGERIIPVPQRILVATDFSEAGDFSVKHAYALAQPDSIVRLLHVAHPHSLSGGHYIQRPGDCLAQRRHAEYIRSCARRLRALVQEEASSRGIVSETTIVEHATPAVGIVEEAERFGADIICLGTHGRTGISTTLFKSVAQRVLAKSRRPLFLAHPPEP